MMKTILVATEIAFGLSVPALAESTFDIADEVCGSWLVSGPMTECSYSYDRGHYNIDATIDMDGIQARQVCPQLADTIAAVTSAFSDQSWRLRLFTPYGEPIARCRLH
jgi:hypothetical protein